MEGDRGAASGCERRVRYISRASACMINKSGEGKTPRDMVDIKSERVCEDFGTVGFFFFPESAMCFAL